MKRQKQVFGTAKEVAHIWASGSQEEGRNGRKNIFFEKDTIYSYGHHFPLAYYDRAKNRVICNSNGYSVTTAGHKGEVRSAVTGRARFVCLIPLDKSPIYSLADIDLQDGAEYLLKEATEAARDARRAKSSPDKVNAANEASAAYYAFKLEFKIKGLKVPAKSLLTPEESQILLAKNTAGHELALSQRDERRKRQDQLRAERVAAQEIEREKIRQEWLTGAPVQWPYSYDDYSKGARLRIKDDVIETSKGAKVPLKAGLMAFKAWQEGRLFTGAKIGAYTVDSAGLDYCVIGCHKIDKTEAERVLAGL